MGNYRVPTIEEFVPGFKFEVYSEGVFEDTVEDFEGWYEYTFDEGINFRDIDDVKNELSKGNIRVAI